MPEKGRLIYVTEIQTWELGGVKLVLSSRNRPGYRPGRFHRVGYPGYSLLGSPGSFWVLIYKNYNSNIINNTSILRVRIRKNRENFGGY
jgi:hypothetical protein